MKKILTIIGLLQLCLICGCNQQPQREKQEDTVADQTMDDESFVEDELPFSKSLVDEIQQSISDTNHLMWSDIYGIWFAKTDGDCCIAISTANFYHSQVDEGFFLIDEKLIVYYGTDVISGAILEGRIAPFINRKNKVGCSISCLIDTTLLLKDCPADFPDENSDEALYTYFDPYGKIFKVHNCDSLELIYVGFL